MMLLFMLFSDVGPGILRLPARRHTLLAGQGFVIERCSLDQKPYRDSLPIGGHSSHRNQTRWRLSPPDESQTAAGRRYDSAQDRHHLLHDGEEPSGV
jgi:hypothetical protein